jgi:hypothetical protein
MGDRLHGIYCIYHNLTLAAIGLVSLRASPEFRAKPEI